MLVCSSQLMIVLASVIVLLAHASFLRGEDREKSESSTRIQHLIELLASKNAAPEIRGNASKGQDQTIRFPDTYDRNLQVPVYLTVQALLAEDESAIDFLLAHKNDDRYSFSVNSYNDYNVTVSKACSAIAHKKVYAYEPEIHVITRSQFGLYPKLDPFKGSSDTWDGWWQQNKHRGLATLQVEAIDVMMEFMRTVDGKTALPWHAAASPLPLDEFNRLRDENLEKLKAIREFITKSKTPYRPKTLEGHITYFFGLPWTGRRHNK